MSKNQLLSAPARVTQISSLQARDEVHSRGRITQSSVTADMIQQRARELALIAGRAPKQATTSDLFQAKRELFGDEAMDDAADESNIVASGMGAPPTSTGHQVERHLPTDDEDSIQLVQEGVDEAEHEQMVQAAKTGMKGEI
jgi:hypothetical protein